MRTTKKELMEMLEDVSDYAEIILRVRGNSTTDYSEQEIIVTKKDYDDVVIIQDRMSY